MGLKASPADEETARLLGIRPDQLPLLAKIVQDRPGVFLILFLRDGLWVRRGSWGTVADAVAALERLLAFYGSGVIPPMHQDGEP